jgi:hypothetical protein
MTQRGAHNPPVCNAADDAPVPGASDVATATTNAASVERLLKQTAADVNRMIDELCRIRIQISGIADELHAREIEQASSPRHFPPVSKGHRGIPSDPAASTGSRPIDGYERAKDREPSFSSQGSEGGPLPLSDLSRQRVDLIKSLAKEGRSRKEIAQALGVTAARVGQIVRRAGFRIRDIKAAAASASPRSAGAGDVARKQGGANAPAHHPGRASVAVAAPSKHTDDPAVAPKRGTTTQQHDGDLPRASGARSGTSIEEPIPAGAGVAKPALVTTDDEERARLIAEHIATKGVTKCPRDRPAPFRWDGQKLVAREQTPTKRQKRSA